MGVFDKLRDVATMRSFQAAVKKGDPEEVGKAAVAAVNRLGAEGLARLDPAKAEGVALKAMERISRLGEEDRAPVHAAVAAEATWELRYSGLSQANTEPADEAAFSVLNDWTQTDYVAAPSVDAAFRKEDKGRDYAFDIRNTARFELSPQERAQDHAEWLAGEGPSDAAIQQWEDQGIAEVTAEMEKEEAAEAVEAERWAAEEEVRENEVEETGSSYDYDEIGNEYAVAFGKSDEGFHYSLTGANSDRSWAGPFSTQKEAEAALSKDQDDTYRTGDYGSDQPEAAHAPSPDSPEEVAAFKAAIRPPAAPDFAEALKQEEEAGPSMRPR